ncbi:pyruvate dehydrogenase (acetyl-transferring) E1 component subunit alpha [Candidatus Uabimicrobium amorphum]|uniref:Pyruvate dehydrogenase E1 component subunit alpha n=1 Tax=Uabimicrobium amorphum TaxID=2596890 RepID=A0A5S9IU40_UABAM|nr:pyruvate dehydrogenase (acetyl-transferring) E1 component subunit alpha [Candidatus Uabimicrobium amorphum]BBM87412.1 pyruvate dehydrogenase E1 component subunit alpha [Candidatus Uabimicrobium amorphum]
MTKRKNIKEYDRDFLLKLLKEMLLIRRFEELTGKMYRKRKIGGFCHLYIGQEATCVGTIATLDLKTDYVMTAYRDHGHAISCGMHPNVLMAELFGKATGCAGGKGGSMHFFDKEKHFLGGHGIVGAHLPLAAGYAFKINYRKDTGVVLVYFGDGAIHQGAFHETLNMAKIWDLPIIFICENNLYGMGTAHARVSSVTDFSVMANSYNMPGKQINGMDVLNVYEETMEYVKLAKEEKRPSFMEIRTYRYQGHSMSDPAKYREKEELEEYKNIDSIEMLKQEMIKNKLLTEDEYAAMDKECKDVSQKSVEFAENSDEPPLSALYEDVLV